MKTYNITINGVTYAVEVEEVGGAVSSASVAAPAPTVPVAPVAPKATPAPVAAPAAPKAAGKAGSVTVKAPMPGNIIKVNVKPGDAIKKGDVLLVLEAMKMENDIVAPSDGIVKQVLVTKGSTVDTDQVLVII